MTRFSLGQHVRVINPLNDEREPLKGMHGVVTRVRISDGNAWVNIPTLPEEFRAFPKDDPSGRGNHVVLDPQECELVNSRLT